MFNSRKTDNQSSYARVLQVLVLTGVLLLLASCSPPKLDGRDFAPYQLKNPNNAVIYLYRPYGEQFAWAREYHVVNSDNNIKVTLKHGGYYPLEVRPGRIELVADRSSELTLLTGQRRTELKVEKGKSYYVKLWVDASGWSVHIDLIKRTEEAGLNDLRTCRLLKLE